MQSKKIIFTGGGSAGHVVPNLALIEKFQQAAWQMEYIGSNHGIELDIIARAKIPYHAISTGRLRRYITWKNIFAPLGVLLGLIQAIILLYRFKPHCVFSKGGYVAFPVVLAAWLLRIPAYAHESDLTPGLANRLSFPFLKKVFITFEKGQHFFKNTQKVIVSGTPIRSMLMNGDRQAAQQELGFDAKPVVMIMGGGLGAASINKIVVEALPVLTQHYNVIHLTGKGKQLSVSDTYQAHYRSFEGVFDERMANYLAYADLIVSRAGANSIYEFLKLEKVNLLLPLSRAASRGDQIDNANYVQALGLSAVLVAEQLNVQSLIENIEQVYARRDEFKMNLKSYPLPDAVNIIYNELDKIA